MKVVSGSGRGARSRVVRGELADGGGDHGWRAVSALRDGGRGILKRGSDLGPGLAMQNGVAIAGPAHYELIAEVNERYRPAAALRDLRRRIVFGQYRTLCSGWRLQRGPVDVLHLFGSERDVLAG